MVYQTQATEILYSIKRGFDTFCGAETWHTAFCDHTVQSALSPSVPTPQGRRAQQLKTRPECWIRGLHEASTQGIEVTSANLFRKECLGMQRSPKAMLLRPTNVDLPE